MITDRDPGDETNQPTAETAEPVGENSVEDLQRTYGFLVVEPCTGCGKLTKYVPFCAGSHQQLARFFAYLATKPFLCADCETRVPKGDS